MVDALAIGDRCNDYIGESKRSRSYRIRGDSGSASGSCRNDRCNRLGRVDACVGEWQYRRQSRRDDASLWYDVRSSGSGVNSSGLWDLYNPQRIAENHAVMVNNFTSYLLNTSNLINNALASNMRVYNTALEQTRDNVKDCAKTNSNYIQTVSGTSQNRDGNTSNYNNNIK